jgi:hypothetical protein
VDSIRVALIDMPRLLNQLVRGVIVEHPELELVANVREPGALAPDALPHFVVVGGDGFAEGEIECALAGLPLARVLILRDDGRSAFLDGVPVGELSPDRLAQLIVARRPQ